MLYFNRNGVWFTIPLKKDGVYSRELLEKQIHTSLLSLQNLKDRSPDLEQMRFEKPNEYLVTSVFGRDEIIINPNTLIQKGTKKEKQIIKRYENIPVPVYELWEQPIQYTWLFKKFWVNLGTYWNNPEYHQNVPESEWRNRNTVEFVDTRLSRNLELFKLRRVGFSDGSTYITDWETTQGSGTTEYFWEPLTEYPTTQELLGEGTWYGPNLGGTYWKGYVGSNEKATIYGTFSVTLSPYTYFWNYLVYYWSTIDGEDVITGTNYSEFTGPIIERKVYDYDSGNTVSINGIFIYNAYLISYQERTNYLIDYIDLAWPNTEDFSDSHSDSIQRIGGEEISFSIDVATIGDQSYGDYEAWCVVLGIDVYEYAESSQTIKPWYHTESDSPEAIDPNIRLIIKAFTPSKDGSVVENIIYEGETHTFWTGIYEYPDSEHCEIYDFFGTPVYVFTVHIERNNADANEWLPQKYIYCMIYKDIAYISEVFEEHESYSYEVDVYNCNSRFGLFSSTTCRAVGMKKIIEIETETEFEET